MSDVCFTFFFMLEHVAGWNFIFTHETPKTTDLAELSRQLNLKLLVNRVRMDDPLPFYGLWDINYQVWDAQGATASEWVCVSVGANCGGAHVSHSVGVPEWAFLPLFPSHEDAANRVCAWRCHFRRLAPPWLCRQDAGKSGRPECNSCQLFLFRCTPHTRWLPKRHICHLMWNNTKNGAPLWTDNTACVWKQRFSLVVRKADRWILRLRLLFPLVFAHWQTVQEILVCRKKTNKQIKIKPNTLACPWGGGALRCVLSFRLSCQSVCVSSGNKKLSPSPISFRYQLSRQTAAHFNVRLSDQGWLTHFHWGPQQYYGCRCKCNHSLTAAPSQYAIVKSNNIMQIHISKKSLRHTWLHLNRLRKLSCYFIQK